jgi:predicted DNA binding CopG/RHH family protein
VGPIRYLDWRVDRLAHIARHHVWDREVEEVLLDQGSRMFRVGPAERNPDETIYRVYGRTEAGRYIFVAVLLYEDGETALPLTARDDASREETVSSMSSTVKHTQEERLGVSQERIKELTDYYDRTDTAGLEGEEVDPGVIDLDRDMEQVSIRLPRQDLESIKRRAERAGVGYTTMIRMILHAHLDTPLTY